MSVSHIVYGGLITYGMIVASVFAALIIAAKAKTWLGFILGLSGVFFVAIILVSLLVH